MGFLIGAFGKLMAGKRVRQLQARMVSVQSQLRRATRDIANMERFLTQQERNIKTQNQAYMSNMMFGMSAGMQGSIWSALEAGGMGADRVAQLRAIQESGGNMYAALQGNEATMFTNVQQQMTTMFQYQQQAMQSALMQQNTMLENNFETYKEMQLQPLKDLEEDLTVEKESLETQIQLAQNDYKSMQEMEKAGAENLVPRYTGQS